MGPFDKAKEAARQQAAADAANPKVAASLAFAQQNLKAPLRGVGLRTQLAARQIGRMMRPDETPQAMVLGMLGDRQGIACLTDRQLIFVEAGLGTRLAIETFLLEDIDTIGYRGIGNRRMMIAAKLRNVHIEHIVAGDVQKLVSAFSELRAKQPRETDRADAAVQSNLTDDITKACCIASRRAALRG